MTPAPTRCPCRQAPRSCDTARHLPDARLAARAIEVTPDGAAFDVDYDGESLGRLALRVPGLHNVRNALAAIGAGIAIGVTLDAMRPGLEGFTGVERRFQRLGEVAGVTVIDDYAHHPTEIRATLDAARAAFPHRRIVAAFQPHLYSRTRDLAREFGAALATADVVFLTEIYPAREQPIAGVTAALDRGRGHPIRASAGVAGRAIRTGARHWRRPFGPAMSC